MSISCRFLCLDDAASTMAMLAGIQLLEGREQVGHQDTVDPHPVDGSVLDGRIPEVYAIELRRRQVDVAEGTAGQADVVEFGGAQIDIPEPGARQGHVLEGLRWVRHARTPGWPPAHRGRPCPGGNATPMRLRYGAQQHCGPLQLWSGRRDAHL